MELFKKGQKVTCSCTTIGYKTKEYLLVVREDEEDEFTNRELLREKDLYIN